MFYCIVLVYACGQYPIDPLLTKLRQNDDKFTIEELTLTPSFLFNEYISKISVELNLRNVLLDCCGCPGQTHDDLHKAVKYFALKPFGSEESKSWKVLRLIHEDGEVDSRSWSSLFDHVEVMSYGELDDEVVNHVVDKLGEYVPSRRASSIDSGKPDVQLLEAKRQERKREHQELTNTIITGVRATINTVIEHGDKKHEETQDKLDIIQDNVALMQTQQSAMSEYALFITYAITILMCILLYIIVKDLAEQNNAENSSRDHAR